MPQNLGYGMDLSNLVEIHGSHLSQMPSIRFAKRTEDIFTKGHFCDPWLKHKFKLSHYLPVQVEKSLVGPK